MKTKILSLIICFAALYNVNAQSPSAPVTNVATFVTSSSFIASWNNPLMTLGFYLDVAVDDKFVNCVSGYQNLYLGNAQTYNVNTNLISGSTYYYRVRAFNEYGTSSNSNAVSVILIPNIVSQPVALNDEITIEAGKTITLTVNTSGAYDYQWHKDGINLKDTLNVSGVKTKTLTLTNTTSACSGSYDCIVYKNEGSVRSSTVALLKTFLSVNLLNFQAYIEDNKTKITWSTASETNTDYFTVQSSKDGISFKDIKHINGAGNSNNILNYSAVDYNPYEGASYYRIMQTDFDGHFTYSNLIAVDFEKPFNISIYPNPFNKYITIDKNSKEVKNDGEIKIYNVAGEEVMNTPINQQLTIIETSGLPSGTYFYKIIFNDKIVQSGKLISQL